MGDFCKTTPDPNEPEFTKPSGVNGELYEFCENPDTYELDTSVVRAKFVEYLDRGATVGHSYVLHLSTALVTVFNRQKIYFWFFKACLFLIPLKF